METNELFIKASRKNWRYPSVRGDLNTEQLWDLPLLAKNNFDLNTVAKNLNHAVKDLGEENFVEVRATSDRSDAEGRLNLVKYVISVRQEEAKALQKRVENAEKRRKILDALAQRENEELTSASKEDLLKQLEELGG